MTLVNKESVNTKFFKGDNIVLAALVIELFQLLPKREKELKPYSRNCVTSL